MPVLRDLRGLPTLVPWLVSCVDVNISGYIRNDQLYAYALCVLNNTDKCLVPTSLKKNKTDTPHSVAVNITRYVTLTACHD